MKVTENNIFLFGFVCTKGVWTCTDSSLTMSKLDIFIKHWSISEDKTYLILDKGVYIIKVFNLLIKRLTSCSKCENVLSGAVLSYNRPITGGQIIFRIVVHFSQQALRPILKLLWQ